MIENNSKSRSWILTQSAEKVTFEELQQALEGYIYIGQLEQGKEGGEQGYKHYQIYIENPTPIRFNTLKNKLFNAHIEPRNGTRRQAYDYVTKSETKIGETFGNGVISLTEESGRRNDFEAIIMLLEEGATLQEVRNQFPTQYLMYRNRIETYLSDIMKERLRGKRRDINVTYIYGKTGSGKTSFVLDKYGDENVYIMSQYPSGYNDMEKFDGYNGEDVILFDEFRSSIPLSRFLRYIDRFYCELPARYNYKMAAYTQVYIVSNWTLEKQYPNIKIDYPEDYDAFMRRIHTVYNFDVSKQFPIPKFCEQLSIPKEHLISEADLKKFWKMEEVKEYKRSENIKKSVDVKNLN